MGQWVPQSMQMAERKRHWCKIKHHTTKQSWRSSSNRYPQQWEVLNAPRRDKFRAVPSVPRKNGRERRRHMECGRTQKTILRSCKAFFSTAWREITHVQPEATRQVPPQEEPNDGQIKEDNARLLAQMPASRVWQQQTGAEGRSVKPRRRASWSKKHVRKTARMDRKEIIRIWRKITVRSWTTYKHQQLSPGQCHHPANS